MREHRVLVQLVLLITLVWQKGVNEHRHGPSAYRLCLSSSHNSSLISSCCHAQRVVGWCPSGWCLMASLKTPTWSWSESSSPLARQRTAAGRKAPRERPRDRQPRPRGGLQESPFPDSLSSGLASTKKTRWIGWTVDSTEWGPIKKWLPEACNADFLLAQETHLPKDALVAEEA